MPRRGRRTNDVGLKTLVANAGARLDDDQINRAWRARGIMEGMLPGLTEFANSVSESFGGRTDIEVQIGAGKPRTDGSTIVMPILMQLADLEPHDRRLCSKRDADGIMLCPGCRGMDAVTASFIHEIAHIVSNSADKVQDRTKIAALNRALKAAGNGNRGQALRNRVEQVYGGYLDMAKAVSPFLPLINNALEDARVNRKMVSARAGAEPMFRGKATLMLRDGIETINGETIHWRDLPLNSQAAVGMLLVAEGNDDLLQHLDPMVQDMMSDPMMQQVCHSAANQGSMRDIFELSFKALEHARRHGFFLDEDDPEDEPPTPPPEAGDEGNPDNTGENDQSESPDGGGNSSSDNTGENDGDASSGDGEDGDSDDGDDTEADGSGGSNSENDENSEQGADDDGSGNGDDSNSETKSESGGTDSETDDDCQGNDGDESGELYSKLNDSTGSDPGDTDGDADPDGGPSEYQDGAPGGGQHDGQFDAEEFEGELGDDELDWGDADDAAEALQLFGEHDDDGHVETDATKEDEAATDLAAIQGVHFDDPSRNVVDLHVMKYEDGPRKGKGDDCFHRGPQPPQSVERLAPPEGLVGGALMRLRRLFAENKRAKRKPHRSGRINAARLATVRTGNKEVFTRASLPGKRDYDVLVALDLSGSTSWGVGGRRNPSYVVIKEMAMTLGEMMSRLGVDFSIYAHEGQPISGGHGMYEVDIWEVKSRLQPWDTHTKERVARLTPGFNNLDGHALEFFRKRMDESTATDRIIIYVTDGSMPEANAVEERRVLKRELAECQRRNYTVIGVGIGTDSPRAHGLDTAVVNGHNDIHLVVDKLEEYLR